MENADGFYSGNHSRMECEFHLLNVDMELLLIQQKRPKLHKWYDKDNLKQSHRPLYRLHHQQILAK